MKTNANITSYTPKAESTGVIYKILRIFTVIHPGEALTAFLLALNVFLLLAAYYIIRPVREDLLLGSWSPNLKSYLGGAIAVLLIFVVKAFSGTASKLPRQKLITWVTLFFISNLVIFNVLNTLGVSRAAMGIIFFTWAGIFNLMVVAQFWAFANDVYTEEMGKRLFPIVAFGATFGGFVGGTFAGRFYGPLGAYQLMLVSAGILGICILLTHIIHRREIKKTAHKEVKKDLKAESLKEEEKPLEKGGGFRLLSKNRYLLFIALFVLLLNFINTNGEYILSNAADYTATSLIERGEAGGLEKGKLIGKYYANFFSIMNAIAMFIQLFLVSRIFKWFGVRVALFALPLIALCGYFLIGIGVSLIMVKWIKRTENATDYSLMNTTRHALFLITSREEKYKAKAAIDTFFHRSGDVLSAILVFSCATLFTINFGNIANISIIAQINVVLVALWIIIGAFIAKEHKKISS